MQANDAITKQNIKEAFIENVREVIDAGISIDQAIPTMTDLGDPNRNPIGNYDQSGATTSEQLPAVDLASGKALASSAASKMDSVFDDANVITPANMYQAICAAYHALSCFHKFKTEWKFRRGGGIETRQTIEGRATFASTMGDLPTGWSSDTRSIAEVKLVDADNIVNEKTTIITASGINDQLAQETEKWAKACDENGATTVYTYTTCHANCHCHGNCHDNRGRR